VLYQMMTLPLILSDPNHQISIFLPCDDMLARYMLSSCLSVRQSAPCQNYAKTAKHRIMETTPLESSGALV